MVVVVLTWATVPMRMGGTWFGGFLDLRKKVFFSMRYPGVVLPPQVKVFSSSLSYASAQGNFLLRPILHRNACREVTQPCAFLI
jgi:hypothetical protein